MNKTLTELWYGNVLPYEHKRDYSPIRDLTELARLDGIAHLRLLYLLVAILQTSVVDLVPVGYSVVRLHFVNGNRIRVLRNIVFPATSCSEGGHLCFAKFRD